MSGAFVHLRNWLLFLGGVLLCVESVPAQEFREYEPSEAFENKVRAVNPACMPAPYPISADPYAYRLMLGIYRECAPSHYNPETGAFDKPNMTDEEAAKWAALAVGSALNPVVAGYAGQEVLTSGGKCVLRSLVDASDTLSPKGKKGLKTFINGAGTAFDWYGFTTSIPELANPSRAKAIEAAVSTYLSSIDRIPEGTSALEFLQSTWDEGIEGLRQVYDGPRKTAWKAAQFHANHCEFSEAREQLELARKETDALCIANGQGYRQAEKNMAILLPGIRGQLNLPFGRGDQDKARYNLYLDAILLRKDNLTELIEFYGEMDRFEKGRDGLNQKARDFLGLQNDYTQAALEARRGIGTRSGCLNTARALRIVSPENLSPQCRVEFFHSKGDGTPTPEFLVSDLAAYSYDQRDARWAALGDIRMLHQQCDFASRDQKIADLRNVISSEPMFRIVDGACAQLEQPELLAALDVLSGKTPEHCKTVRVPEGLEGLSLSEAARALEVAGLYSGKVAFVPAKDGQKPDVVIETDPLSGATVRLRSLVDLTVTKAGEETPEPELIAVPPLLPATEDGAKTALANAGLVGVTGWEVPADRIELTPGDLVAASPAVGDMVAPGATITLTVIGPRPKIEVPSITDAKTLEEAKRILRAAGFVPGDEFETEQAAPAGNVSVLYHATYPPIGSKQEMFSTVSVVKYGLFRVPEAVIGMMPEEASQFLNKDGRFTAGSVSDGIPVAEGEDAGRVQLTVPAIGTPVAKGTVVNLKVGVAASEDLAATEPESESEGSAAPVEWPPEHLLFNPNVLFGPVACVRTHGGEEAPIQVWRGPNGEWACLFADKEPEGEDADDPAALTDGDWIGRWHIASVASGKDIGVLEISETPKGLLATWFTFRKGKLKKFMEMPMAENAKGVLSVHPEVIRKLDAKRDGGETSGEGVLPGIVGASVEIVMALRTLEASRAGEICQLSYDDPKKGRQTTELICQRE